MEACVLVFCCSGVLVKILPSQKVVALEPTPFMLIPAGGHPAWHWCEEHMGSRLGVLGHRLVGAWLGRGLPELVPCSESQVDRLGAGLGE